MDPSYLSNLLDRQALSLGYPGNTAYDYSPLLEKLPDLFKCKFNNIGPVDKPSLYGVHTKDVEKKVLGFFADLWKFDKNNVWGYVTANGTEGNLQALYVARELFPNAWLYFSKDSHYSIKKIAKMLKLPYEEVASKHNGEMDTEDFEKNLSQHLDSPVIICANIGTTMKGAIDNTREIYRVVRKFHKHKEYFMHADGALMGFLLPLFQKDILFKRYIHSITISGHKFLGVPFPCGIFLLDTMGDLPIKEANFVEYIDCSDCTISGSRSGHAALFMEYMINLKGRSGFEADAAVCIENAEYLVHKLNDLNYDAWRNSNSVTVVFKKPKDDIVKKYQLASEGDTSHVIVLVHVTKELIDRFILDLEGGGTVSNANMIT